MHSIKKLFFLPPPQIKYLIKLLLFLLHEYSIPLAIKYPVKLVMVAHPFSKESFLAKDISKSFISNEFVYELTLKFSIA